MKTILHLLMLVRFRQEKAHLQSLSERNWIEAAVYILPSAALDAPGFLEGAMPIKRRLEPKMAAIEEWAQKEADRWERDHPAEAPGMIAFVAYWPVQEDGARYRLRGKSVV